MTNLNFSKTPFVAPKLNKIFGTMDASVDLTEFGNEKTVKRALSALPQVPMRFYRDNLIACEGDAAEYIFFVIRGVVRSCKIFQHGARNIVAFYLPGDLFGWTVLKHSLSIEAVTNTEVLFLKRSALLSIASRDSRVASFLLDATTNELGRAQDHILLMSKSAKCRLATFFTDLWVRLGKPEYLDVPMSNQDIADHVGLTIETVSRTMSDMERSKMITRVSYRRLILENRLALGHMMSWGNASCASVPRDLAKTLDPKAPTATRGKGLVTDVRAMSSSV
jgi:CRP/FNR family transcriptional regulator, nitrogen fixation regulation protein